MGQTLTQLINANIEALRKGPLPQVYQKNKNFAVQRVCKDAETYRITKTTNGLDFRAPIELGPPGNFGAVNLDGGALGLGTGFSIAQFYQSFFDVKMGFQLTYQSVKGTATSDQSVLNAWQLSMERGIPNMARYEDVSWHNLGGQDGQVGVATSFAASSATAGVYTMDPAYGARLFIPNQSFEIISSGGSWVTSAVSPDNLPFVNPGGVNYAARQISITNPSSISPAAGDVLYFGGATPGGTPTWLQGLYYVNTTATSGTYLGLSRSTYPTINSSSITSGGTLTPAMVLALRQLITVNAGDSTTIKLIGLVDPHQVAIMSQTVQSMQTFYRQGVTEKQIDPLPEITIDGGIVYGGLTHYQDALQSSTRIDYCNPDDWGRVYLDDKPGADFYRAPGSGEMFFPVMSTTNGAPTAQQVFYLISTMNYFNVNPMNSGLIANLTPPSTDYTY